jgi:predicted RNase H-like HicB family nuclease
MTKDYHINIFFSEEDQGYIADIPDLEMCSAFGDTPAEALAEVETAKQLWLNTARAEGKPIPEPSYRPIIYKLAS